MEVMELIKSRHSVRDFLPDPIPEAVLKDMLEAARLAPSAQNKQPWRYLVYTDPERIKELARHCGLIGLSNFFIKKAPCLVIACAETKKNVRINSQDYYLVDVTISFQQMMMAALAHGVGSCWLAAFSEKKLREYLKLPKSWKVVAMAPFGYPKEQKSTYTGLLSSFAGSAKRMSLEEMATVDGTFGAPGSK